MKKIVISILHYNSNKDTIACLDTLKKANLTDLDVSTYVLDNASPEQFEIDEAAYKKIDLKVLRNATNTGFTGGHNLIFGKVKNERFDFLLLLNNDSLVDENCLINLVDGIRKTNADVVVPKIYFTKGKEFHKDRYKEEDRGKVIWYAGGVMDWNNVSSSHIGVDEVDRGQFDEEKEIDFATGACVLVKKNVLEKVGLFDEKYFLYYEDADLSARLRRAGFRIIYYPKAVVWHNNAGSSGSGSALHDYYLTRNRLLFGLKYAPIKTRLHLLRESVILLKSGRVWQKKGIRDFILQNFGKGSYK